MAGDCSRYRAAYNPQRLRGQMAGAEQTERIDTSLLCGRGEVIFGSMLDYVFDAELSEAFDCSALAEGHPGSYTIFTPIFTCNPLRRSAIAGPMTEISPTGAAGFNQGNIAAYPRIELAIPEAGCAGERRRESCAGYGNRRCL